MSDLQVKCKLRKKDKRIRFKKFREGGAEHYNVKIWLSGEDDALDTVERVEYKLHSSSQKPVRITDRRDKKFRIYLWTWGMFEIAVKIHRTNGDVEKQDFYLDYTLPADTGDNYIDLSE